MATLQENVKAMVAAGVPEEEIGKYIQSYGGSEKAKPQERGDWSWSPESMARGVGIGTGAAINGISGLADALITNPVNYISNALGAGSVLTPSREIPRALGLPQPENRQERLTSAAVEGGASALPFLGTGAALGGGSKAAQEIGAILRSAPFVQGASGASGNLSAESARESGAGPIGQTFAGLAGGLAPAGIAAAGSLVRATGRATGGTLDAFSNAGRERIAGDALKRMSSRGEGLDSAIAEAFPSAEIIPGSYPTTAQLTGDRGLFVLEKGLRTQSPDKSGVALGERYAAQREARAAQLEPIRDAGENSFAQLKSELEDILREAQTEASAKTTAAKGAAENAQKDVSLSSSALESSPGRTPEDMGATIRGAYDEAYSGARDATRKAYASIDPDRTSSFDVQPIGIAAKNGVDKYFGIGGGKPNAETVSVLNDINTLSQGKEGLPFEALQNLRSRLGEVANRASRNGEARDAALAGDLRSFIDRYIASGTPEENITQIKYLPEGLLFDENSALADQIRKPGFDKSQAALFQSAKETRSAQGKNFESGSNLPMSRRGTGSEGERIPDAAVPGNYFKPGESGVAAAKDFRRAVGDSPDAVSALQDYAISKVKSAATNPDGTINVSKWRNWMDRHDGALRQLPDLKERLSSIANAQEEVDRLMSGAKGIAQDASGTIEQANVYAKDAARRAESGLRAFGSGRSDLVQKLTREGVSPANERAMLESGLYSPEHIETMKRVRADIDRALAAERAAGARGSDTAQNMATAHILAKFTGGGAQGLPSGLPTSIAAPLRILNNTVGRLVKNTAFSNADNAVRGLLTEAMLDPQVARELLSKATPARIENLAGRMNEIGRAYLLSIPDARVDDGKPSLGAIPKQAIGRNVRSALGAIPSANNSTR